MPKKKKKEKGTGGGADGPAADVQPASLSGDAKTGGLTSELLSMSLNKASAPRALPPLKSVSKHFKDADPNLQLLGNDEMSEMEKALESHGKDDNNSQGIGGGLNVFAINKDGISRAVMKFTEAPKPMPLTISFHFPGTFLTHRYVVAIVKGAVQNIEEASVTGVQYVDRNVRLGTRGLENRWLVTVNSQKAKDALVRQGLKVVNRTITVRSYDDLVREEYQEFVRYSDLQKRMKMGFGVNKTKKPGQPLAPGAAGGPTAATAAGGTEGSPGGTEGSPGGTEGSPGGTEGSPGGTEGSPGATEGSPGTPKPDGEQAEDEEDGSAEEDSAD